VLFERIGIVVTTALIAILSGCVLPMGSYTDPIGDADTLPNGTVGDVRASPKRNANAVEVQAIQRAVRTNPLLSNEQVVSNVRVEAVSKPSLGFCGYLNEDAAESDNVQAVVTGVLKTVEGRLLAYDLRYGDQAQLRCSYMQFWPDTKQ
tara:strand:+ start:105900 stop:106346 length:447 start_codon:yes stop_codon:yes gene_type:complete